VSALHPLQIWLHLLGICRISKTKVLIRSEVNEDNIKNLMHEKMHSCNWQRGRAVKDIYVIGSHVKKAVSS
jgi:hypothetical protein